MDWAIKSAECLSVETGKAAHSRAAVSRLPSGALEFRQQPPAHRPDSTRLVVGDLVSQRRQELRPAILSHDRDDVPVDDRRPLILPTVQEVPRNPLLGRSTASTYTSMLDQTGQEKQRQGGRRSHFPVLGRSSYIGSGKSVWAILISQNRPNHRPMPTTVTTTCSAEACHCSWPGSTPTTTTGPTESSFWT